MAPYKTEPTQAQLIAIAMTPRIVGFLSLLGSGYIIYDCQRQLKSSERGRGGTVSTSSSAHMYQRLMIGLSLSTMIMAFGFVLSTLPIPKGTPLIWGAVGNTQSCTFAGMFTMMGVVPNMYNASLSIYYLLRIKHGWSLSQLHRIEPWLHCVPWLWGVSVVAASLALKLFNSGYFECWLAPYPQGCTPTFQSTPDNPPTCTRGDNIQYYQWGFDLIPKLISILVVTINMYLTWLSLYQQEKHTQPFSMAATSHADHSSPMHQSPRSSGAMRWTRRLPKPRALQRSQMEAVKYSVAQRLAVQSYFYVGAMYITITPVVVARIYEETHATVRWIMLYFISLFVPAQGIWNAIVYLRPRYLKYNAEAAKRRKRLKSMAVNVPVEGPPDSNADENDGDAVQPVSPKSFLKTIGDTFRDGAVDDEEELAQFESQEVFALPPTATDSIAEQRVNKVRFWSIRQSRNSVAQRSHVVEAIEEEPGENG